MKGFFNGAVLICWLFSSFLIAQSQVSGSGATETQSCTAAPASCMQTKELVTVPAANGQSDGTAQRTSDATVPLAKLPEQIAEQARPLSIPAVPLTEFQKMVADSVGTTLPQYGASLFRHFPATFAPVEQVPVPANYVVGPGDEVLLHIWGQINLDLRSTVDRNGEVFIPKVGAIRVAGEQASGLDDRFRKEIGRIYRNFDVTANLGRLRTIDVFVVGQAIRPGKYTVGSLSTLVNALFASGGAATQGSLRHIQLKRNGTVVTDFDLYDLLLKGDKSKDAALQPNDVLFIPPIGPQIAVSGSVKAPAIYELKDASSTFADAIELAGGLNSVADGTKITVERIDDRKVRSVAEFSFDQAGVSERVRDGDIIRVLSIVPRFSNAVTLRGNVANPGRYPWHPGMRLRELVPNKSLLLTRGHWNLQNGLVDGTSTQYRGKMIEEPRTEKDAQYAAEKFSEKESNTNSSDVKRTRHQQDLNDVQPTNENKTERELLLNDVKVMVPEINWDYAVIQRSDPVDLSTTLIPFSPLKAIIEGDDGSNLVLQPGDIVTFFSQKDISVPQAHQTKFVRVEGEVKRPGIYRVAQGETVQHVLEQAGGLTENAYLFGTMFTRESSRKEQQASLDQLTRILETELEKKAIVSANSSDNAQTVTARIDAQRRMIEQLRKTKAAGRVVLQIKPDDTEVSAMPSIILEDGDRVFVPSKSAVVNVVGAVFNQTSFLYRPGKTVGNYIREAGNGDRSADLKHVLLVRADGSIVGRGSSSTLWRGGVDRLRVLPGDSIVIPAKLDTGAFSRALRDWTQVASQLAITAASLSIVSR